MIQKKRRPYIQQKGKKSPQLERSKNLTRCRTMTKI